MGVLGMSALIGMALGVAYEVYFLSAHGATPGKMALGLRVIRTDGGPISPMLALGRHFAMWISAFILMIGYIMAGVRPREASLARPDLRDSRRFIPVSGWPGPAMAVA